MLLISASFVFLNSGKPYRDKKIFTDVVMISKVVPSGMVVGFKGEGGTTELITYLQRYNQTYLSSKGKRQYYISEKGSKALVGYNKLDLNTNLYNLHKLKE